MYGFYYHFKNLHFKTHNTSMIVQLQMCLFILFQVDF